MKFIVILIIIAALAAAYFIWVRPYLKSLPSFSELWAREASLWGAFKEWLDGRRTILAGLWGSVVAWAPDALQQVSGFDLKTLLHLPEQWALWVTAFIPVLMAIFRAKAK
jgi:hypothetical protein